MEPVVEVKNLSKSYTIGHGSGYGRLSETIADSVAHPIRKLRDLKKQKEVFWAIKDVSFTVKKGEVIGLIGRNGAGKSTVLKIISRITYPTSGEVVLRGRVGSLLEVGTGFHPELTGRENIYMSGAILGMRKNEIDRNFDEIVKFSEMEKFLDTPVKRYSSGMYVRLGFAVAAHLQPEILLVDEVLAVGDAQFQKKCLGKIHDVSQGGKTVLFVSHNMSVVEGLCEKAILIDEGKLKSQGDSHSVIAEYMRMLNLFKGHNLEDPALKRYGSGEARFTYIELLDKEDQTIDSVTEGVPFKVSLTIKVNSRIELGNIAVTFLDRTGRNVLTTMIGDSLEVRGLDRGTHQFMVYVNPNPFIRGSFNLKLSCRGPSFEEYDTIDYAYNVNVVPNLESESVSKKRGVVNLPFEWNVSGRP